MEKVFDVFDELMVDEFFWRRGGGGRRNKFVPKKIFLGLVGHNPKKSGKFLSAPLIFSFPYAHGCTYIRDLSHPCYTLHSAS